MTDNELLEIIDAISQTVENIGEWKKDYCYDKHTNEFHHFNFRLEMTTDYAGWFKLSQEPFS